MALTKKILTSAALSVTIAAMPIATAAQEVETLRFGSAFSPMSVNNRVTVPGFAEAVAEASGGTLVIEHYPGGSLGSGPVQQLSMVENGVVDIAEVVTAYSPGRFPELSLFELPFLAQNNVEAGLAAYSMYEDGLLSDFDDLMLVGIIISGPYGISANTPLDSLEDLEGLRLRVGGPIQTAMAQALGAVPVGNIPAPQIAENISRGLIDGTLMAPGNLFNFRITDAATHHLFDLDLGSVAVIFPMRRDTYEGLSEEARAAFDAEAGENFTRALGENLDIQQDETVAAIEADETQTIHSWSDEDIAEARERLAAVAAEWDTETDGVNLYEAVNAALSEVRAAN
jgi:TRAP-type C4-dicarboxylate transport system substrate-binding protein